MGSENNQGSSALTESRCVETTDYKSNDGVIHRQNNHYKKEACNKLWVTFVGNSYSLV